VSTVAGSPQRPSPRYSLEQNSVIHNKDKQKGCKVFDRVFINLQPKVGRLNAPDGRDAGAALTAGERHEPIILLAIYSRTMSETDLQEQVFALLADPATHRSAPVRRIDTHAASVFLAGERVYKVKRAVKFPFLDYSTRARRKAACEAELEVNRPYAPGIYRGVVAITREANGSLALAGAGEPVEWAVAMNRFDENATLDRLADRGKVDAALADALARAVAKAHTDAPIVEAGPWLGAIARFIAQNDVALRATPALFPAQDIATLTQASDAALNRLRPLLLSRGRLGLVRRGHGDLHLGNIALIDAKPVPFDAIEFDPLIATGDVLYDLAFLLMDLVERHLDEAANVVLNRYLAQNRRDEDFDALTALPLFMSLRAAIRAKVTAARLASTDAQEQAPIAKAAKTYFDLACTLISPSAPLLLAVGGLSGTGKSVLARKLAFSLAPAPGAVLLRSDVERKALSGVGETEPLPQQSYSAAASAKVYASLYDKARRIIAAGHSAIVDAVFAAPEERAAIAQIGASLGVRFRGLFLVADLETRLARVGSRTGDASDANARVVRNQEDYDLGTLDWTRIDAAGSPEATLEHARTALAGLR
jgi:aminoglycoside phosphotransferase family enzyme/predicted kinase